MKHQRVFFLCLSQPELHKLNLPVGSLLKAVPLCVSLCPDLQFKAAELNRTLSRKDGTADKSLTEMKEEIQAMLAEMRKRQLGGMKSIAEEEEEYESTHHRHTHITHT